MSFDPNSLLGVRVRLTSDAIVGLLLPPNDYTGTVVEIRSSEMGNPTKYRVRFDGPTPTGERDVDVLEHEFHRV